MSKLDQSVYIPKSDKMWLLYSYIQRIRYYELFYFHKQINQSEINEDQ